MVEVQECEEKIAQVGGWRGSVLASRATTGLAAALWALGLEKESGVVMPVAVCANVVYAVKGAGLRPVFVDVEVQKGGVGIQLEAARRAMQKDGRCKVLLAIPLFGGWVDWSGLLELAKEFGLVVVEDAAQAGLLRDLDGEQGDSEGRAVRKGSVVCSVVSFGVGKVGSAKGGGAVLSDDPLLLERVRGRLQGHGYQGRMQEMAGRIAKAVEGLEIEVGKRIGMAGQYRRRLVGEGVMHVGDMLPVWKYSVLVGSREVRDRVTSALIEKGIEATNLYPPLTRWFAGVEGEGYERAQELYSKIVNLPLWDEANVGQEHTEWTRRTLDEVEAVMGKESERMLTGGPLKGKIPYRI